MLGIILVMFCFRTVLTLRETEEMHTVRVSLHCSVHQLPDVVCLLPHWQQTVVSIIGINYCYVGAWVSLRVNSQRGSETLKLS